MSKLKVLLLEHNLQAHWPKKPRPFLTLPEAGDKDIFALFNGFLDNLPKGMNQLGGANIGKAAMVMDGFSNVGLAEGHGESPVFFKQINLQDFQGYVKRILDQWLGDLVTVAFHTGASLFICKVAAYIFPLITVKDITVRFTVFEVAIFE